MDTYKGFSRIAKVLALVCGLSACIIGFTRYVSGNTQFAEPRQPVGLSTDYQNYFKDKFGQQLDSNVNSSGEIYNVLYNIATDTVSSDHPIYHARAKNHLLDTMHYLVPRDQLAKLSPEVRALMIDDERLFHFMIKKFHPDSLIPNDGMLRYFVEYDYSLDDPVSKKQIFRYKNQTIPFYIEASAYGMIIGLIVLIISMMMFRIIVKLIYKVITYIRSGFSS